MKHQYDWSKLDAGWKVVLQGQVLLRFGRRFAVAELEMMCSECPPDSDDEYRELWSQALWQLTKCRVVDNTPLFEAMDRMAAEVPAEEWAKVPQVDGSAPLEQYDGVCKAGEYEPSSLGDVGQGDASEFVAPYQPWRRGHLAVWTLVNISCHDGRLTVVMKRGRGEMVMESGPDDEVLWERLGAKVVEVDKAKAKEKSDG